MVVVTSRTWPITAVAILGNSQWDETAVVHLVAQITDTSEVVTGCGQTIAALPRTWQKVRACKRCPEITGTTATAENPELLSAIGQIEPAPRETFGYLDDVSSRARLYGLHSIRHSSSKKTARMIAKRLGYDPPETIGEEYPDLLLKVKYVRKRNAEKYT